MKSILIFIAVIAFSIQLTVTNNVGMAILYNSILWGLYGFYLFYTGKRKELKENALVRLNMHLKRGYGNRINYRYFSIRKTIGIILMVFIFVKLTTILGIASLIKFREYGDMPILCAGGIILIIFFIRKFRSTTH